MTVTNRRIYGTAGWGKRVDLPVDSVSAVGTNILNGIAVGTSSGRISFFAMDKRDEIHSVLSELIITRQNSLNNNNEPKVQNTLSGAEEIKKYKELLDSGIITQEEFDEKKKQLLSL